MTAAQQLRQEGIEQGMEKGRQEGIQQGIVKGVKEGIQQEKLGIARNMLSQLHLDMQVVQQATGLSRAALLKLQERSRRGNESAVFVLFFAKDLPEGKGIFRR